MHAPADRNAPRWLSLWIIVAAFGTYFCMYAFRKPFTAATYTGVEPFAGFDYKTVLVTAQLIGYMLSKFIGIKVISELKPHQRAGAILWAIGLAELALIGFGATPAPYNMFFLFLNGLPLGMVFGFVLGYLEGRQMTEFLTAWLCASFIVSSGVVKSVGSWILKEGVPEFWMPAATGALFIVPLCFFVWMLTRIPPPTAIDVEHRSERAPLTRAERWRFFWSYAPGLVLLLLVYCLVTLVRTYRDDYGVEIWKELGYDKQPAVFTQSETLVMFGVVALNGSAVLIVRNRLAFYFALGVAFLGSIVGAVALAGNAGGWIGPFGFMVMTGLGFYFPYVAVHTTIFERLIALTRDKGNLGYLMYLADTAGYFAYAAMLLGRKALGGESSHLAFFRDLSWITVCLSAAAILLSLVYFSRRLR